MQVYEGYIQGFPPYRRLWICEALADGTFRCQYEDGRETIMFVQDFESYYLFQNAPKYVYNPEDVKKGLVWKSRLSIDSRRYVVSYGFVDQLKGERDGYTPIHVEWCLKGLPVDIPYGSCVDVHPSLILHLPDYHPQKQSTCRSS